MGIKYSHMIAWFWTSWLAAFEGTFNFIFISEQLSMFGSKYKHLKSYGKGKITTLGVPVSKLKDTDNTQNSLLCQFEGWISQKPALLSLPPWSWWPGETQKCPLVDPEYLLKVLKVFHHSPFLLFFWKNINWYPGTSFFNLLDLSFPLSFLSRLWYLIRWINEVLKPFNSWILPASNLEKLH